MRKTTAVTLKVVPKLGDARAEVNTAPTPRNEHELIDL
jgi:hypothetical protein